MFNFEHITCSFEDQHGEPKQPDAFTSNYSTFKNEPKLFRLFKLSLDRERNLLYRWRELVLTQKEGVQSTEKDTDLTIKPLH